MKVLDWELSERHRQRRKSSDGRLLHCCCICGNLETWGPRWTTFCSEKELDEGMPISKFCSQKCRIAGGHDAKNVTEEMKRRAKDAEWREPRAVYRDATPREGYRAALDRQSADRPLAVKEGE